MTADDHGNLGTIVEQLNVEKSCPIEIRRQTLPDGTRNELITINDSAAALEYVRQHGKPAMEPIRAIKGLLILIVVGVFLAEFAFIGAGILLVVLGATGQSEVVLFGAKISSANVGIVSIFLGAVVLILTIRTVLYRIQEIMRLPPR